MVERMGAAHFRKKEVLRVIGMGDNSDAINALADSESDFNRAYHRGRLKSELEVREAIFLQARNGSSPAQSLARQIIIEGRMHDIG